MTNNIQLAKNPTTGLWSLTTDNMVLEEISTTPGGALAALGGRDCVNDFHIFLDGDQYCATAPGFVNLQESSAGFGSLPITALLALLVEESGSSMPSAVMLDWDKLESTLHVAAPADFVKALVLVAKISESCAIAYQRMFQLFERVERGEDSTDSELGQKVTNMFGACQEAHCWAVLEMQRMARRCGVPCHNASETPLVDSEGNSPEEVTIPGRES